MKKAKKVKKSYYLPSGKKRCVIVWEFIDENGNVHKIVDIRELFKKLFENQGDLYRKLGIPEELANDFYHPNDRDFNEDCEGFMLFLDDFKIEGLGYFQKMENILKMIAEGTKFNIKAEEYAIISIELRS